MQWKKVFNMPTEIEDRKKETLEHCGYNVSMPSETSWNELLRIHGKSKC